MVTWNGCMRKVPHPALGVGLPAAGVEVCSGFEGASMTLWGQIGVLAATFLRSPFR
jgi:hypothetical protein